MTPHAVNFPALDPSPPSREIGDEEGGYNAADPMGARRLLEIEIFRRVETEKALSQAMSRLREYKYRLHNLASEHTRCSSSYQACYSLVIQNHKWILDHANENYKLHSEIERLRTESVKSNETMLPILDMTLAQKRRLDIQVKKISKLPSPMLIDEDGDDDIVRACEPPPTPPRRSRGRQLSRNLAKSDSQCKIE
ncbi:MAG: hypothetical protein M1828_001049 [Chrysothrix sp. TS-e1954]|nr:MAG: hypothetical protein M1828_001049 [Chrysothrix sp. TS-e1954]